MIEWIARAWVKAKVAIHKLLNRSLYKNGIVVYGVPKMIHRKNISLGKNCIINESVYLHGRGGIILKESVTLSFNVALISLGYDTNNWEKNKLLKKHVQQPIQIGKNCWIGANATILMGVTIADDCVIAAGSVVTKDLDRPNSLYAGNPARFIKSFDNQRT